MQKQSCERMCGSRCCERAYAFCSREREQPCEQMATKKAKKKCAGGLKARIPIYDSPWYFRSAPRAVASLAPATRRPCDCGSRAARRARDAARKMLAKLFIPHSCHTSYNSTMSNLLTAQIYWAVSANTTSPGIAGASLTLYSRFRPPSNHAISGGLYN